MKDSFRTANRFQLVDALQDARDYTLALFECFQGAGMDDSSRVPFARNINPPLWELGHIAWFAEWYALREAESSAPGAARRPALLKTGDSWFDSNAIAHAARWHLDLPKTGALKTYCREVLERVQDKLVRTAETDEALYPFRLGLAHEDSMAKHF